ncbi:MAG: hypothetical protein KAU27_08675 [Desulfuromonadales bacterium]|nr:hypothetical protein [Desulfuromonadales bacterium]
MTTLKRAEIMKRASFLRHGEKMILKFDLSELDNAEEVKKVIEYFSSMVTRMPKKSIVGLVDLKGLKVADEVTHEMINLTESCNPYFRATAVIANDDATTSLANAVISHYGKINMPIYIEEEAAKEWLFSQ